MDMAGLPDQAGFFTAWDLPFLPVLARIAALRVRRVGYDSIYGLPGLVKSDFMTSYYGFVT